MPAFFEMDFTVNRANTLANLNLNIKDADTLSPVQVHLIEEHQYSIPLGAMGVKTISIPLATPSFTNTPRDGVANFDPGIGMTELQLQYPFSAGGTGAVLDITIHEIRIRAIPEPAAISTAVLAAASFLAMQRRRSSRQPC